MIYLFYIAEAGGIPIWKYEHPRTPDEIIENITGRDDAIVVGYLSTISHFSKTTLGSQVQMINLGKYNMYYWYFRIDNKDMIGLVVCDAKDKKEAVLRVIEKFIEDNYDSFKEFVDLVTGNIPEDEEAARKVEILSKKLSGRFQEFLDSNVRSLKYLSMRDFRTILIGSITAYAFFLVMLLITFYLDSTYQWFARGEMGILVSVIVVLDFLLPAVVLGYTVGFRDGALIGGLITGIAMVSTVLFIYHEHVYAWSLQWKMGLFLYPAILVLIFVIGGIIGLIASFIGENLVEKRTLVIPSTYHLTIKNIFTKKEKEESVTMEKDESEGTSGG